jgi:aconitate hydratase A / 2-methylisocitrate dehydratase
MQDKQHQTPKQPTASPRDPFGALAALETGSGRVGLFRLSSLKERGIADVDRLPFSIKILLENALRNCDGFLVTEDDVEALARWQPAPAARPIPFLPSRVLLQDLTGVPAVADLAAMRSAFHRLGGDPKRINPIVPVDLVIDHSVQVDYFGTEFAFARNVEREFERNRERYIFLRWAQKAFRNFRVVPPGTGIVHQVNLEALATVVDHRDSDAGEVAFPDTLVGTDSHTTMINGLGVLGWGVGGIEAEAVMLGQPISMLMPEVIGVRLEGELNAGMTATDLVLTITQLLRRRGVVDKFVEFFGPGLSHLSLADRATIGNMSPEYGATCGFFPVDAETLRYLRLTGRPESLVQLVEAYTREQGLFRTDATPDPVYSDVVTLDLETVEPSVAGPRRPQDRIPLGQVSKVYAQTLPTFRKPDAAAGRSAEVEIDGQWTSVADGAVAIAAITSCTNTSNPSVMVGAGLLARNAVQRGMRIQPYVKTSLAPGSPVVVDYLEKAGVLTYLDQLRFNVVGFGCTTCIGNSGPLPAEVSQAVRSNDLVVAAVLSGNRNFEGRINPDCKMNFLASPPLVVAYALAGRVDVDLTTEPLGVDDKGQPVYLADLWPSDEEVAEAVSRALNPEDFTSRFSRLFHGDERWRSLPVPEGDLYEWDPSSTYIQEPPFFATLGPTPDPLREVHGARVLAMVGDSVTTDHISPAGSIPVGSPAGLYLVSHGVTPRDFSTYGARRGNHEVMVRGTLANIRLRNMLAPGTEGGLTVHLPETDVTTIYEASVRYQAEGTPLLIVAGAEYGTGSSRDWAAKGPLLLGVRAVLAKSYERIHRSNLIGMGILPLQFLPGKDLAAYGLTGREVYDVEGISTGLAPGKRATVIAKRDDGTAVTFEAIIRLDSPVEVEYYSQGGILQYVLRQMAKRAA